MMLIYKHYFNRLINEKDYNLFDIENKYFDTYIEKYLFETCRECYGVNQSLKSSDIMTYSENDVKLNSTQKYSIQSYVKTLSEIISPNNSNEIKTEIKEFWERKKINESIKNIDSQDIDLQKEKIKNLYNELYSDQTFAVENYKKLVKSKVQSMISGEVKDKRIYTKWSGFEKLNDGFGIGFFVIGARPSFGKTLFALNITSEFASQGYGGIFFSFDDNRDDLTSNYLAIRTGIEAKKLHHNIMNEFDVQRISQYLDKIEDNLFFVFKTIDIQKIRISIESLKKEHNIRFVVIDYLQKIRKLRKHDERIEYDIIADQLQEIAHENELSIFLLSQMNCRGDDNADDDISFNYGHLKGSGEIESLAKKVFLIEGIRSSNYRRINMAKYKHGAIGKVNMSINYSNGQMFDVE